MGAKKSYVVGFDLGGTKVLACLFDRKFRRLAEIKAKSKPQKGQKHFLKTVQKCFDDLLREGGVKRSEILAVGMGCPGIIDERRGLVLVSPNLGFMRQFPMAARLGRVFGAPVVLGNDVNIGLFGEHQFGAAVGFAHVAGIFVGTGIGGALILNNEIYGGATGAAGEVGHVLIESAGPLCGCGRRGCFEALCSRLAIATEAAGIAARQKAPYLLKNAGTDILDIKSGQLVAAVKHGDKAIEELIRRKARRIGTVMADLVNLLNPQMIVLGGGLVEALPNLIVKEAAAAMQDQAMPALSRGVKVVAARLGDYAIAMGAAKRAWDRFGNKG
jgi:glucokinase